VRILQLKSLRVCSVVCVVWEGRANAQRPSTLAVFSQAKAAKGLQVTDNGTTCTRTETAISGYINARLERPSADTSGAFTVTWQCVQPGVYNQVMLGWGQPTLGLTQSLAWMSSGNFVAANGGYVVSHNGHVPGRTGSMVAGGRFQADEILSLVYHPGAAGAMAGTIHASRNGAAPQLIYSGLAHDLVPVACFSEQGVSWRVVG
jgi:hypothetical protein